MFTLLKFANFKTRSHDLSIYTFGHVFHSDAVHVHQSLFSAWFVNPLIATLKPQSNGPSYSDTVIGTLAVDG